MNKVQRSCGTPKAYASYPILLSDENVDAVSINTPPVFHEEMVLKALEAGKHVLCEKPLSTTVEGCVKIKNKAKETDLMVLPAHNYSFTPGLMVMENLIAEDRIGSITGMSVSFENSLKQYRPVMRFRTLKPNGIVEDVLPHILSVIQPILGYCTGVTDVNLWRESYDVYDNMSASLMTASGITASCTSSWTKLIPSFKVVVEGEEGKLRGEFSLKPFTVEYIENGKTITINKKGLSWYWDLVQMKHPSFQNQYQHFHDLVANKDTPRISIQDEINIVKTVNTISEHIEE